jgi:hypothetical protein
MPALSLIRVLVYRFSEVIVLISCSYLHVYQCVFMTSYCLNTSSNVHYIWPPSVRALYSRIRSIKSPSFCIKSFNASLTTFTALLPQSGDCGSYVSRPVLAPPPLWLHNHTHLRAHEFAHTLPTCDISLCSLAPEAGDFVQLILQYIRSCLILTTFRYICSIVIGEVVTYVRHIA